jgi:hypothetical protein
MKTRGLPHSCFELDAQVERLETGSTRMEGLALWLHQVRLACSDALPRALPLLAAPARLACLSCLACLGAMLVMLPSLVTPHRLTHTNVW